MSIRTIVLLTGLLALVTCLGYGQEINQQSGEVSFTGPEAAALLRATQSVETSPDITINIVSKSAAEMPAYDAVVHYAGLNPTKPTEATIWLLSGLKASQETSNQLQAATELACMDTGFAGPKWKAAYDYVAGLDAKLPPEVSDRYRNRHMLTGRIQQIIDSGK
ncbi:MAG TPA: hypothetical protein VFO29_05610 [Candidatus Rubrimentiphilum sp.]|nr:hypothetical protein [Candidatus Rubrimentiphilum sp.]